jgi:hypothetical protein
VGGGKLNNRRAVQGVGLRPLACWDCGYCELSGRGLCVEPITRSRSPT